MRKITYYLAHGLSRLLLVPAMGMWRLSGWRFAGEVPELDKYVFAYAPHTTNWDYVHMLPLALYFKRRPSTIVKHTLVKGPFGWFFRLVGAIPIDRSASTNVVQQVVDYINTHDRVIIVIAPEGTRKKRDYWRSGFYYIALEAGIPIVLGFLNYEKRVGGVGITVYPTGDIAADMAKIRAFFDEHAKGKYPENLSDIRIRPREEEAEKINPPPDAGQGII